MSGDIAFEKELQRTISVDIRYVLFIIDKYYGAKHIIEELDLAKSPKIKKKQEIQSKVMESDMNTKKKQKVKTNPMGVKVSSEKN